MGDAAGTDQQHALAAQAGKGVANPTAIMLAGAMMLDYMEQHDKAKRLRRTVRHVVGQGEIVTPDLGGRASTSEFTDELVRRLEKN